MNSINTQTTASITTHTQPWLTDADLHHLMLRMLTARYRWQPSPVCGGLSPPPTRRTCRTRSWCVCSWGDAACPASAADLPSLWSLPTEQSRHDVFFLHRLHPLHPRHHHASFKAHETNSITWEMVAANRNLWWSVHCSAVETFEKLIGIT